jgi:hypothetical protein
MLGKMLGFMIQREFARQLQAICHLVHAPHYPHETGPKIEDPAFQWWLDQWLEMSHDNSTRKISQTAFRR